MTAIEKTEDQQKSHLQIAAVNGYQAVTIIPIVQETFELGKETVETSKIHISKKVTEQQTEVNIPLTSEEYEINRVPVNQVVSIQPEAVRHDGDTIIISVIKEVLVVEKRYEIVEEIHVTKRTVEKMETQQITLREEQVQIDRTPVTRQEKNA